MPVLPIGYPATVFVDAFLGPDQVEFEVHLSPTSGFRGPVVVAMAGIGAIGEELNPLVNGTIDFSEVELSEARALDNIVFNGYLMGLDDAGWQGDPRLVRFGFTAASALCYNIGYGLGDALPLILDEDLHPWTEQVFGQPMEAFADLWAHNDRYRLDLADEARALLGRMDELRG